MNFLYWINSRKQDQSSLFLQIESYMSFWLLFNFIGCKNSSKAWRVSSLLRFKTNAKLLHVVTSFGGRIGNSSAPFPVPGNPMSLEASHKPKRPKSKRNQTRSFANGTWQSAAHSLQFAIRNSPFTRIRGGHQCEKMGNESTSLGDRDEDNDSGSQFKFAVRLPLVSFGTFFLYSANNLRRKSCWKPPNILPFPAT